MRLKTHSVHKAWGWWQWPHQVGQGAYKGDSEEGKRDSSMHSNSTSCWQLGHIQSWSHLGWIEVLLKRPGGISWEQNKRFPAWCEHSWPLSFMSRWCEWLFDSLDSRMTLGYQKGYCSCPKLLNTPAIPFSKYPRNTLGSIRYLLTCDWVLLMSKTT
jgi:hypothetical protein